MWLLPLPSLSDLPGPLQHTHRRASSRLVQTRYATRMAANLSSFNSTAATAAVVADEEVEEEEDLLLAAAADQQDQQSSLLHAHHLVAAGIKSENGQPPDSPHSCSSAAAAAREGQMTRLFDTISSVSVDSPQLKTITETVTAAAQAVSHHLDGCERGESSRLNGVLDADCDDPRRAPQHAVSPHSLDGPVISI